MTPAVNGRRMVEELKTLATFSDTAAPAITRIVFSPPDLRAREWIRKLCRGAGLTLREDAVGNLFARWEGLDPRAAAVATGSHIDAIPNSGQL